MLTIMLTIMIEAALLFFVNWSTDIITQAKARRNGTGAGLSRKPQNGAQFSLPAMDPPVVIGEVIPSVREALRQRGGAPAVISLTTEMRSKHLYLVAKSGMGKTNFNVQLIDSDISAGRAVVLLDYRGDLVDRVCRRIAARYEPDEIAERLLILDLRSPPDTEDPPDTRNTADNGDMAEGTFIIGFNPLAQCGRTPYARGLFVFDLFQQYFGAALGVQTSETLQNSLLALALTGGTLLDVEPLLSCASFRAQALDQIRDSSIRRFFARLEALPEAQRTLWVNPIQNKLAPYTINPLLRQILGSSRSVSIPDFLDQHPNGIILFCAGADEHYGSTAILMSNLFVHAVASAVMRTDRTGRHPVHLYADEFQNLCGDKFSEIISEGRRFGLSLTLSHQSPGQLEPKIRNLVRNVVSTSLFGGVGGQDAELLAGEIPSDEPKTVIKNLLINQKPGEAMLLRQGQAAVRIRTAHSPDPDVPAARVRALYQASLRRHGCPVLEVEAELSARDALFDPQPSGKASVEAPGESKAAGPVRPRGQDRKKSSASQNAAASRAADQYEVRDIYEMRDIQKTHNSENI